MADERKGQESVSYGCMVRGFAPGTLGIHVDPLVVLGRLRKLVYSLLGNCQPFADADFLSDVLL